MFYAWFIHAEKKYRYESQQYLHLSLAASLARDNPLLQKGIYDHHALQNLFHTLMVLGPAFEFYFLDPNGKVLTHSSDSSSIKRGKINLMPIIALTHNKQALPIYGDDPRHKTRQKIFSAAPVFNGSTLQGYLYVIVTGERYEAVFNRALSTKHSEFSLLLVCVALVFLFLITLGIFRYVTHPLRKLIQEIKQVQRSAFNTQKVTLAHWKPNTNNEVHQLGCIYQEMLTKIREQVSLLQKTDEHRREVLTDISHDLRTPLASLQGYIEMLYLDEVTLSAEQKKQYMGVVLKNTQQLKKLIDQIFELAHLENDKSIAHNEVFNLIEFLYDVSAKFAIKLQEKNISCSILPSSGGILVISDIAKLERVVSNLLENAIRHTAHGGEISMVVSDHDKNECIFTVSDNGTGIKEDEITYIFDPRYRASNAIQDNESHNGLGLAITKKLLQIMQTDIRVKSELHQGTSFSFNLHKANTIKSI